MRSTTFSYLVFAMFSALATPACTVETAPAARPAVRPAARPAEARAMRDGFFLLGERIVDGQVDHDVIPVGRDDGRFREIMLVVERAPVEIYDVVVTFGNGERFEPRTRLAYHRDTTSRNIDLPGGARVIRRVDFRYGNLIAGTRPRVELWAR